MINRLLPVVVVALAVVAAIGCGPDDDADVEAPRLSLDADAEETYTAGEDEIYIELTATDPQNMDLEFEMVQGPEAASFDTHQNSAIFNWTPTTGDITGDDPHEVVFSVANEAGKTTERSVDIFIVGQEGTRFVSSSSQLYNPSSESPLSFDVEVDHDEAPQVILTMPADSAPEGATFAQVEDFEGEFEWMPAPSQLETRTHRVVFEADDGDEVVTQEVTIIIQSTGDAGETPSSDQDGDELCEAEAPIDHQPIEVGRGGDDYEVEGTINDDSQDWEEAVLYWTFDDPIGPEPEFETRILELDGDDFSGAIDNPELDGGDSAEISYAVCAYDTEVEGEDGIICGPVEFYYRFIAYAPREQECIDDGIDLSDPDAPGALSAVEWEPYRVCGGAPKYHELELDDEESAEVLVSYPVDRSVDVEAVFDDEQTLEVADYPCIGLASIVVDGPGTVQIGVFGDDIPYHATAFVDGGESDNGDDCEPEHQTPGDAHLIVDDSGWFDDVPLCSVDDRDVYAIEGLPGDNLDSFVDHDVAEGPLSATLYGPSQTDEITDGGTGLASEETVDGDLLVAGSVEEPGLHYLSVEPSPQPATYGMGLVRHCGIDDQFAGNQSREDAETLGSGSWEDLKVCDTESDWFRMTNETGDDAWLWADVDVTGGSESDIEVLGYEKGGDQFEGDDDQGNQWESVVNVGDGETVEFEVRGSGAVLYDLELATLD